MKITKIRVGITIPGDNYDNIRPEIEAEIEDWEDYHQSMLYLFKECLKLSTEAGFNSRKYYQQLPDFYKSEIRSLKEQIKQLNKEYCQIVDALEDKKIQIGLLDILTKCLENIPSYINNYSDLRKVRKSLAVIEDIWPGYFHKDEEDSQSKAVFSNDLEEDYDKVEF